MPKTNSENLFLERASLLGFDVDKIWNKICDASDVELQAISTEYANNTFKNPYVFNKLAGAINMLVLYRNATTSIDVYLEAFEDLLLPEVVDFIRKHKKEIYESLDFSRDFTYGALASYTMINNYLSRVNSSDLPFEVPQFMFMRLAVGASHHRGLDFVLKTIRLCNDRIFSFASPTIYNMGFKKGAPTSCMVITVDDSLSDIYSCITETAMASKNNAGIGIALNKIRCSTIGRFGKAKGVAPLMKILDHSTEYVNQGGRRPGATTVTLPIWHYDIFIFITSVDHIQDVSTQVKTLNNAVMINDLFMERLNQNGDWYCMCPKQAEGLAESHSDDFRELYLKYEKQAIEWNKWKEYQEALRLYDISPDKNFEKVFSLMSEIESEDYVTYWLYKHLQKQEQKTPSDVIFLKENRKVCESYINKERLNSLHNKVRVLEKTKTMIRRENSYIPQKKNISICEEDLKEYERLKELYSEVVLPTKAKSPPEFLNVKYKASYLMETIFEQQRRSGMPYINYADTINRMSPNQNVGHIYSLNLCQEIALPTIPAKHTATCNIASICLKRLCKFGKNLVKVVDYEKLSEAVQHLTCVLNDILDDATPRMSKKAADSNNAIRPIGIGVNGWAELMYKLDLSTADHSKVDNSLSPKDRYSKRRMYLNPKTEEVIHNLWSCIYYNALKASCDEAKTYGPYEQFSTSDYTKGILHFHRYKDESLFRLKGAADPSIWGGQSWDNLIQEIKTYGLRNSTVTTQMPTATSAQVLEASEATELSGNFITRRLKIGDFTVQNYHLISDLDHIGLWNTQNHDLIIREKGSIQNIPEEGLTKDKLERLQYLKTKYQTPFDVQQSLRIREEAIRQKFTDQARSFTLYFKNPDKMLLGASHKLMWKSGIKSSYYVRSQPANDNIQYAGGTFHANYDEYEELMCAGCQA